MKTATNIGIKKYLTFGCLFIAFFGFAQTINVIQTNQTICGEDNLITIKVAEQTKFNWSCTIPATAYINNPATILYTSQPVNTIYLKPDLSQLESDTFTITISTVENNTTSVSQIIKVKNYTKIWRGGSTTNWADPNNWKPYGVPGELNCVIVPESNIIISGTNYNAYAKNVTVKSTGLLEIQPENNLTVENWIHVNAGGIFNVKNNASLVQVNDDANAGNIRIERTTKPMGYFDYTYWNSPVTLASNFTLGSLSPHTLNDIWSYNPSVSGGCGNWVNISPSTVMNPATGYIIKAPDTFSSNPATKVPFTATFVGTPNNGTILAPITKGIDANMGGMVADVDDEWNLIGNPYPSGIDAKKLLESPENLSVIDGTIYIWTHIPQPTSTAQDPFYGDFVLNYTTDDYSSFNKTGATGTTSSAIAGGTAPTGFIATGQSFFVKASPKMANGTTANVTFNNRMRIAGKNSDFFKIRSKTKNNVQEEKHRIWLNLTNNSGAFSQTLIGYISGATQDLDRGFDGESFGGNDVTFYSIIPEANLSIQGRALPFNPDDVVALGYKAAKKGNYSIRIDHLDGIFTNQSIYLEDKDLHVLYDLKQKPYVFNTKVGNFNNRFALHYGSKTLGIEKNDISDNDIKINYVQNGNILAINNNSLDVQVQKVTLYTILGQSISSTKIENQTQQNIEIPIKNLYPSIYIALIKTSLGDFSKKIIVQ